MNGETDIKIFVCVFTLTGPCIYLEAPAIQTQDRFGGLAFIVQGFQNGDRLWGGVVIAMGSEKMKHL